MPEDGGDPEDRIGPVGPVARSSGFDDSAGVSRPSGNGAAAPMATDGGTTGADPGGKRPEAAQADAAGDGSGNEGAPAGPADADDGDDDAYAGVLGAFPYAFRSSSSWIFRLYVPIGGLLATAVGLMFNLSLIVLLGATATVGGGTFTFSRAFFILVGLAVVVPLVAPVLFVARRTRRVGRDGRYDRALGALGFLFVASLFVGLVISTPAAQQATPTGPGGPVLAALYALPRPAGLLPPAVVAWLLWRVGRGWA